MFVRGISLLDILIVLVVLSIGIALALPLFASRHGEARRVACASNLSQIGKGMILYADEARNGGFYPTVSGSKDPADPAGDAQEALTLLYKNYLNDVRVFSCPSKSLPTELLRDVYPAGTQDWRAHSFKQAPRGSPGRSTSYGYSLGHTQEHGQCIVLADRQGTSANGNSDNHGSGVGQNCLAAEGNVEFRDTKKNKMGVDQGIELIDDDIYADKTVSPKEHTELESYLR